MMTQQHPLSPPVADFSLGMEGLKPLGSSFRSSSGCLCKSDRVLTTSFMLGRRSGWPAQHVSISVLSADGQLEAIGRLYPLATCKDSIDM